MNPESLTDDHLEGGHVQFAGEYFERNDLKRILGKLSVKPRPERQCKNAKRQRLDGVEAMLAKLPPPIPPRQLVFFDCGGFDNAAITDLFRLLPSTITFLNISLCGLTASAIQIVCEYMKTNNSILNLLLWGNKYGDEGARYIADMLRINTHLRFVSFFRSGLSPKGYEYIADALAVNKIIDHIHIVHDHSITDQHVQALFHGLKRNRSVKKMYLHGSLNNVSPIGVQHIVHCLESNYYVTSINAGSRQDVLDARPEIAYYLTLNSLNRKIINKEHATLPDWLQCVINCSGLEDVSYSFFFLQNMPELCMHTYARPS